MSNSTTAQQRSSARAMGRKGRNAQRRMAREQKRTLHYVAERAYLQLMSEQGQSK